MTKVIKLEAVNSDEYYSIDEAAAKLGIKVTVMRNYLYLDKFTTYKFKGLTLISKRQVEAWKR